MSTLSSRVSFIIHIFSLYFNTEKKGKFLSYLKAKAKPIKQRKPKKTFLLETTLQSFKKQKLEAPAQQDF